MCAHGGTRDQVNNCGIDVGLALPESSPVLSIIGGTSVCLHLTPLHFGAVTGTLTILVITPLHFGAVVDNGRTKETDFNPTRVQRAPHDIVAECH